MVSNTLYLDVPSREDLLKVIEGWEEAVKWIADGWDCEDEYWDDLSYREALDKVIDRYTSLTPLSGNLHNCIERVDEKFRQATVESRLCVWDTPAKIGTLNGEAPWLAMSTIPSVTGITIAGRMMRQTCTENTMSMNCRSTVTAWISRM